MMESRNWTAPFFCVHMFLWPELSVCTRVSWVVNCGKLALNWVQTRCVLTPAFWSGIALKQRNVTEISKCVKLTIVFNGKMVTHGLLPPCSGKEYKQGLWFFCRTSCQHASCHRLVNSTSWHQFQLSLSQIDRLFVRSYTLCDTSH